MKTSSRHFPSHLPAAPTDAAPGSEEKIRILIERARLGVSLWHPLDAGVPTPSPRPDAEGKALAGLCVAS
jgi:hypothetical protein